MEFYPYPIQKTKDTCSDYRVWINGEELPLDTARVSKVPINRRWPGHQRPKDQSELINFLSAKAEGELEIEVLPLAPSEKAEIRPRSLGTPPRRTEEGRYCFSLSAPAYFTFEPFGRNRALHFFIDPLKDYGIDPADEDLIYFGPGEHNAGMISLKSNQTLYLAEGAVVYGCVSGMDAEHIKILGRGILDNSRNRETILFAHSAKGNTEAINNAQRIHTIQLEYCTDIEIDGITIRDSLVYNIRPIGCRNLTIRNVKIIGCWRYNSDGIDMHNCEDVLIEDCFIRTFDDSICVKGFDCYYDGDVATAVKAAMYRNGVAYDLFDRTVIRRCTIWNDWGKCLEIGAETKAKEIRNILFEDCDCIHSMGPTLDCYNVDYALVRDVVYRNIRVEYDDLQPMPMIEQQDGDLYRNADPDYAPLLIKVITEHHHEYSKGSDALGINRGILFENIRYFGRQKPRLRFKGADETHLTEQVIIHDLYWNGKKIRSFEECETSIEEFTKDIILK